MENIYIILVVDILKNLFLMKVARIDANGSLFISQCTGP